MSDHPWGPSDPLSREQVAAAVTATSPDWRLLDCEPIPEGSDILYRVSVDRSPEGRNSETGDRPCSFERDCVLKCFRPAGALGGREPARFLAEVRLLEVVGSEVDVPVPAVYGHCVSRAGLPTPCFLMAYVEGVDGGSFSRDVTTAERVARQSGRYLARIHGWRSFDAYGHLAVTDGDVVATGPDRWVDYLGALVERAVDGLEETRFSDLETEVRAGAETALADFDVEPVLLHGDYRYGNLVFDPGSGAVEAVLDWGAALAGDRLYELAWAEAGLADEAPAGSERRRRVREALSDAYETERGVAFDRDADFDRRMDCYRFVKRVTEMRWFDYWYAHWDDGERETHARRLREAVTAALDSDSA